MRGRPAFFGAAQHLLGRLQEQNVVGVVGVDGLCGGRPHAAVRRDLRSRLHVLVEVDFVVDHLLDALAGVLDASIQSLSVENAA